MSTRLILTGILVFLSCGCNVNGQSNSHGLIFPDNMPGKDLVPKLSNPGQIQSPKESHPQTAQTLKISDRLPQIDQVQGIYYHHPQTTQQPNILVPKTGNYLPQTSQNHTPNETHPQTEQTSTIGDLLSQTGRVPKTADYNPQAGQAPKTPKLGDYYPQTGQAPNMGDYHPQTGQMYAPRESSPQRGQTLNIGDYYPQTGQISKIPKIGPAQSQTPLNQQRGLKSIAYSAGSTTGELPKQAGQAGKGMKMVRHMQLVRKYLQKLYNLPANTPKSKKETNKSSQPGPRIFEVFQRPHKPRPLNQPFQQDRTQPSRVKEAHSPIAQTITGKQFQIRLNPVHIGTHTQPGTLQSGGSNTAQTEYEAPESPQSGNPSSVGNRYSTTGGNSLGYGVSGGGHNTHKTEYEAPEVIEAPNEHPGTSTHQPYEYEAPEAPEVTSQKGSTYGHTHSVNRPSYI